MPIILNDSIKVFFVLFYQALNAVIEKESSTIPELYYAVTGLVSFGQKVPDASATKVIKNLQASLKKDDNLLK